MPKVAVPTKAASKSRVVKAPDSQLTETPAMETPEQQSAPAATTPEAPRAAKAGAPQHLDSISRDATIPCPASAACSRSIRPARSRGRCCAVPTRPWSISSSRVSARSWSSRSDLKNVRHPYSPTPPVLFDILRRRSGYGIFEIASSRSLSGSVIFRFGVAITAVAANNPISSKAKAGAHSRRGPDALFIYPSANVRLWRRSVCRV